MSPHPEIDNYQMELLAVSCQLSGVSFQLTI
jgi:hypothetical protein